MRHLEPAAAVVLGGVTILCYHCVVIEQLSMLFLETLL
jgi:hypothetical protein